MTDTYSNQDLRDECDMARKVLTTRKLNTELSIIKMKLFEANNALNKTITYDYIYDPAKNINDYFELLMYKLQCMFYESSIYHSIDSLSSTSSTSSTKYVKANNRPTLTSSLSLIPISYSITISWG
jgi:hypothetical protein